MNKPIKPLGHKAYGSIPHLPGSRRGPGDHGISEGQARICCEKVPDASYRVIVQEKLDGSCVSVARLDDGSLVSLGRSGYPADTSGYEQHQMFARWAAAYRDRFEFLEPGERIVGEWLAQAHGTRYAIASRVAFGEVPFAPFDIMCGHERAPWEEFRQRCASFSSPVAFGTCEPMSIKEAMVRLGPCGFQRANLDDGPEGAVWRVERQTRRERDEGKPAKVLFLAKYVRPGKVDGKYLPEVSGKDPVWNWLEASK